MEGNTINSARKMARLILAGILVLGGMLVAPRPASRVVAPDASAQIVPTPTLPGVIPSQTPLPEPPGSGGGGDEEEDDEKDDEGGQSGKKDEAKKDTSAKDVKDAKKKTRKGKKGKKGKKKNKDDLFLTAPVPKGTFSTDALVTAAARLRAFGMPYEQVVRTVYPPFIIGGPATWSNTWGAPRIGPGTLVRTHEGQDIFCRYGDPILAPETGYVSYSNGGLGGLVARVHTAKNSYWYLAHLSEINDEQFPLGSVVRTGDVIGLCGNSGNAKTTPPHVHFGLYVDEVAVDPFDHLVSWLKEAHDRAGLKLTKVQAERVASSDRLTLARRFGDAFTSDLSTLETAAGSLLGASSVNPDNLAAAERSLKQAFSDITGVPANGSSVPSVPSDSEVSGSEAATAKEIYEVIGDAAEGHD